MGNPSTLGMVLTWGRPLGRAVIGEFFALPEFLSDFQETSLPMEDITNAARLKVAGSCLPKFMSN